MNKPLIKFGNVIVNVNNITTVTPVKAKLLSEFYSYKYENTLGKEKYLQLIEDKRDIVAYMISLTYEGGGNSSSYVISIEDCERLYKLFGNWAEHE